MFKINTKWSSIVHISSALDTFSLNPLLCLSLSSDGLIGKVLGIVTRSVHLLLHCFAFFFSCRSLLSPAALFIRIFWPVISLATCACLSFRSNPSEWMCMSCAGERAIFFCCRSLLIKLFSRENATHLSCHQHKPNQSQKLLNLIVCLSLLNLTRSFPLLFFQRVVCFLLNYKVFSINFIRWNLVRCFGFGIYFYFQILFTQWRHTWAFAFNTDAVVVSRHFLLCRVKLLPVSRITSYGI